MKWEGNPRKDHILLGNTMWTAGLTGPGKAKLFGDGYLELQSLSTTGKAAADKVIDVLNGAKLNAKYSEHILSSIYRKACVNGTMNGLCTILDSNMADLGATAPIDDIVNSIVNEFAAVAKHEGVELDLDQVLAQIKSCYDRETIGLHYPSMYQDLITNQRLTEIDYINGAIARKGQKYGVTTPYCSFLTQLIHCKEELLGEIKSVLVHYKRFPVFLTESGEPFFCLQLSDDPPAFRLCSFYRCFCAYLSRLC